MSAKPAASRDVSLGRYAALRPRERLVVDIVGGEIGVFFVGEAVRACLNRCPHRGEPACPGKLMPVRVADGEDFVTVPEARA
jgi:nitrite reductase/ring-hydroxylating ferredoxin subunit